MSRVETLRRVVEDGEGTAGRALALTIQGLILLSLAAFAVETLPDLDPATRRVLAAFEIFTIGLFTLEYLARLALARRPLGFAFSFYGLLDLAAILPFYLLAGADTLAFRAFRLLRLLKLLRYRRNMGHFLRAFQLVRGDLVVFGLASGVVLYVAAVGIYLFEHPAQPETFRSVFDSLWWAVATLTTVGYGDIYPVTIGGRIFTMLILIIGLGIVAVPSGIVATALTKVREEEEAGRSMDPDELNRREP